MSWRERALLGFGGVHVILPLIVLGEFIAVVVVQFEDRIHQPSGER